MLNRILALLAFGWAANAGAFCFPRPYFVVEYVNEGTGHYMLFSQSSEEGRWIDNGGDGGLWTRTGYAFTFAPSNSCTAQLPPVCRFYSPLHNTHFFTPYAAECAALKQPESGWVFEGNEFHAPLPTSTGCPGTTLVVRRLFDGGSDHRYSADAAIIAKMIERGWVDEGIGFCADAAGLAPERSFNSSTNGAPRLADCEANVGPCVALARLAPMPTLIPQYLPPNYIRGNPFFPLVGGVVGVGGGYFYTSRTEDSSDLLQHSFYLKGAYVEGSGFDGIGGYHIVGGDRLSGPYAGTHLTYQLPVAAGPDPDERVFPWRLGRERELVVTSVVSVRTVTRANPSSHAYGMPLIHFTASASGRSLYVTLQSFGTSPGGDYIGTDYVTGWAIVSTSLRENPLFGRRLSGNFAQLAPGYSTGCMPRTTFKFELSKADFQKVLGHASTVDPELSTDPADYFLASFRHHNETYLDATLGMAIYGLTLEIWPRAQ